MYDLVEQIESVRREIGFRERCYPKWVSDKKMSQHKSEHELGCMRAVLATLLEVQQSRKLI